jgi:hypothetical protein
MDPRETWAQAVWKYPLALTDVQTFHMPRGAKPLCVQMQGTVPCLWVRLTPGLEPHPYHVWIVGTGHPMPSEIELRYVGTVCDKHGLVWHVFWEEQ